MPRAWEAVAVSTLVDVAVIGGSGFYTFLEDPEDVPVATPYGEPSAPVSVERWPGVASRSCRDTDLATSTRRT